jgi:hypothetical protein
MTERSSIFEQNYKFYLEQVEKLDFGPFENGLGVKVKGDEVTIPVFGKPYKVSPGGIVDLSGKKPSYAVCVILFKYLLLCPNHESTQAEWISYRDFKDAAPLVNNFMNNVERAITRNFSGRLDDLQEAARHLGGQPPEIDLSYDFSSRFNPLPRVPILLLFNDADEEFLAQCSVLFEKRADKYLDMECLNMVGVLLSDYLKKIEKS